MKFSTKSSYGLRAIAVLALNHGKNPYSLSKIAKKENISQSYLERIFADLKKSGIVSAVKGVGGGYRLSVSPSQITMLSVIEALEGELFLFKCLAGSLPKCHKKDCPSIKVYKKVQKAVCESLRSTTLEDVIRNKV